MVHHTEFIVDGGHSGRQMQVTTSQFIPLTQLPIMHGILKILLIQ
jgi:hypothetical protein